MNMKKDFETLNLESPWREIVMKLNRWGDLPTAYSDVFSNEANALKYGLQSLDWEQVLAIAKEICKLLGNRLYELNGEGICWLMSLINNIEIEIHSSSQSNLDELIRELEGRPAQLKLGVICNKLLKNWDATSSGSKRLLLDSLTCISSMAAGQVSFEPVKAQVLVSLLSNDTSQKEGC
jgi:hypothetical protein